MTRKGNRSVRKMAKNHLKRISAPKTWKVSKKEYVFIAKPRPGPHNMATSIPLSIFFKNLISLADTNHEVKYMLHNKNVLVNNIRRKDHRFPVGLMDLIHVQELKKYYRIVLDRKGRLSAIEIPEKEAIVLRKVRDKHMVKGGKVQLNFLNGDSLFVDKDEYKTGDTIEFVGKGVKQHFSLEKGAPILLTGGRHIGDVGNVQDIFENKIIYKNAADEVIETARRYAYVIGKDKPAISVQ